MIWQMTNTHKLPKLCSATLSQVLKSLFSSSPPASFFCDRLSFFYFMLLEKWEKTKTKTNRRCLQPQLVYNPAFNRRYFQKKRSIYYILSPILTFFKSILPIELCRMTYQVKLCGRELPADAAFINSARRCQWMMTGEQKWGETGRAGSRWLPSSKRQDFRPTSSRIFESVPQKNMYKVKPNLCSV